MEVKITKLGDIMNNNGSVKPTIMTIDPHNDIIKYYLDILKKNVSDKYIIINTKGIIRQPGKSKFITLQDLSSIEPMVGNQMEYPVIGESYSLDFGTWRTTDVLDIIEDDIILTKNSVYLIDSLSKERDRKLKGLGI